MVCMASNKHILRSDRICKVFASSPDGCLMFEDFLDMMSAFSDLAPRSVKAEWAFKIYGRFCLNFVSKTILYLLCSVVIW